MERGKPKKELYKIKNSRVKRGQVKRCAKINFLYSARPKYRHATKQILKKEKTAIFNGIRRSIIVNMEEKKSTGIEKLNRNIQAIKMVVIDMKISKKRKKITLFLCVGASKLVMNMLF